MGHLEFETTMTKLTLMSTFWLLIGAAMIFGTPMDPTEQLRVNVKVKTEANEEPSCLKENEETSCIEEWCPCMTDNPSHCCSTKPLRCCFVPWLNQSYCLDFTQIYCEQAPISK